MATVVIRSVRPARLQQPEYHRVLPFAVWEIIGGSCAVGLPAVAAFVTLAPNAGITALILAAAFAVFDAEYATPWRIDVDDEGVTLCFWHRAMTYDPCAIVVTHDVPAERFIVRRRSGFPTFMRFQDDDENGALRAFVGAGVEIISR